MSGVVSGWSIEHHNYWLLGRLQHHQWTRVSTYILTVWPGPVAHRCSRYMFGTHHIFTLIWVCASLCLCRVEFPHISQFLLMLALRVRLAALELTSPGYTWHHLTLLPTSHPSLHTEVVLINIQEGDRCEVWGVRCDSHQFWWQVSLAGFVLSAPGSLINLSRVVTRCAPAHQSASQPVVPGQNKMRKLYWGLGRAGRAPPVWWDMRGEEQP